MRDNLSKCGIQCSECTAFKENVKGKGAEYQVRIKKGFFKYHDLALEKAYCDGCQADDYENSRQLNPGCEFRECVMENNVENCGFCGEYPCSMLKSMFVVIEKIFERVEKQAENRHKLQKSSP